MITRIYLSFLCILIGLPLCAISGQTNADISCVDIVSSGNTEIILNFDLATLDKKEIDVDGNAFEHFSISDEGVIYENNRPMLPAVIRFVVVPPDAGLELVINGGEPRVVQVELPPALCEIKIDDTVMQGSMTADEPGAAEISTQEEPEGLFPPVIAKMSEPVVVRGVRLVKITTYPVQYDYDNNNYIHRDQIETKIRFTDAEPVNPARHPNRRNRSREFLKFIEALAINGDIVRRDDPEDDMETEYVGHYLVVCHEGVLEYAAPFIEWRRKSGWKMDILSLSSGQASNYNTVLQLIRARYDDYLDDGIDPFDFILLIGDRASYMHGPGAQNILQANQDHADYSYALLEGNDDFPDVAISRWPSGSQATCELAVGRTLAYEANPYMEDTSWFTRGAAYSQHWGNQPNQAWHPTNPLVVRWGDEVLQQLGFDDIHVYEDFEWDQFAARLGPEIVEMFNNQTNVMLGRAELYHFTGRPGNRNANDFHDEVEDNVVFPMEINTCGHGEWSRENMFRQGNGEHLKGYVATTFTWSGPQTLPNSTLWLKMVNGVLQRDMPFGWGYTYAITSFETLLDRASPSYQWYRANFNDFGDPGLQPWIGVPTVVEADLIDSASPETRMVEVHVFEPEGEDDINGAQVTIYHPGDMPDFGDDGYAEYDDTFMMTKKTGPDGIVRFIFGDDVEFETGIMYVTVTGRSICPYFAEIEIEEPDAAIELGEYTLNETEGNEDGDINPGETFTLALTARNVGGENEIENVTAVVTSASPWIEIEENEISFGGIEAGGETEGDAMVTIEISSSCPDGESRPITRPDLVIEFRSGETTWHSGIRLNPVASNFIISEIVGGEIIEVGEQDLNIEIENIGGLDSPPLSAVLISQGLGVSVVNEDARFPEVGTGESVRLQGEVFSIAGNRIIVPGSRFELILILSTEDGFVDTAHFELQVEEARENVPTGPDGYGYVCFDDTDENWDQAPEYDWIEISSRDDDRDFDGELLDFDGRSPHDMGEAIIVELDFLTQFYGYEYDAITVTTNGFIAMGRQPLCTNFQNWPLDEGFGGGAGMIAPFWDNLNLRDNSGVYIYRDNDEHRMIIEWYRLRHRTGGDRDLTFQVVIYDRRFWVTATGDQMILFQYKSISNSAGNADWNTSVPYASVGISSPDGNAGINYTWNDSYPVTAAPLENRRALLFATSMQYFRAGSLWGNVIDFATDEPIDDATIITDYGFVAHTDSVGYWEIAQALAEVPFSITARKQGYNDSTFTDILLAEEDTLEINFDLLHPEFTPSVGELEAELPVPEQIDLPFELTNTGNGPLTWRAEERLRGDANAQPWELRRQYQIGQTLGDSRLQGVVYANDRFYVAGSNDRDPQIYVLDREGELIDQFDQFGPGGGYGHKDLAFDGEWIWGSGTGEIYAFSPEGELMAEIEGPFNPNNNFAWDLDREQLWVSSTTSDILAIDREGNIISELDRLGLRIYGLAYWPDDPDGYSLYIYHKESDIADQIITKMNPETNDTMLVAILEPEGGGTPSAAYASNQFDVYSWVFMAVSNNGPNDRIDIWQIDARRDWFELEPNTGVIDPDESQEFVLTLDATGLPVGITFEAELRFYHNASGGVFNLLIALEVLGGERSLELDLTEGWNLISINVEPENLDVRELLGTLTDEDKVIIFKNGIGQFYLPEMNFCNIDGWDVSDGYQINMTEASLWEARGAPIPADQPIQLVEGWNMKAYFPTQPIDAIAALAGIADQLIIAKDVLGAFYLAEFGFSNMGDLSEGQGYQYKMSEAAELIYQVGEELASIETAVSRLQHFESLSPTGVDMSILLVGNPTMSDQEIGVYSSGGQLIGSGKIDSDGNCGIAAWGDDISTVVVDGAATDEKLFFKLWDGVDETDLNITVKSGEVSWANGNILIGDIEPVSTTPATFGIHETYPNPTNGPMKLLFGLEADSRISVAVYDLSGRLVETLVRGEYKAGHHQLTWDTDVVPSGLYLVKLSAPGMKQTIKAAVLK